MKHPTLNGGDDLIAAPVSINRLRNTGLTMLETIVAIVVGLIVLGGVGYLVASATSSNKEGTATTEITAISHGLGQLYYNQSSYGVASASLNSLVISANIAPAPMVASVSGAILKSPWNANVDIAVNASDTSAFDIKLNNLPKDGCISIVSAAPTGADAVKIGTTTYSRPGYGGGSGLTNGMVPVATAQTACSGSANDVTFTFAKA